jgi:hypothetical protein
MEKLTADHFSKLRKMSIEN